MKVLIICAALLAVQVSANPKDDCMKENDVTAADLLKFVNSGDASKNVKCFFKCAMLAKGGLTEDGKLVLEPMLEHTPENVHDVLRKCIDIESSADLCDLAFRHHVCIREGAMDWYKSVMTKP